MKKNLNYFNYEERNGIFLLSFLLILFCVFIFLQKRVLPEKTAITLIHSSSPVQGNADFSIKSNNSEIKSPVKVKTELIETEKLNEFSSKKEARITQIQYQKVNKIQTSKPKNAFQSFKSKKIFKKKKKEVSGFSINSQNVEDWKQIYGIGNGYASRIIKYQNWLGGFHSKEQIKEVYGITDSFYNEFEKHLLPSKPYRKININSVEEKALGSHPYMSWKDAKKVIRYRKHHFPIANTEAFNSILGIHDTVKVKMLPYLEFNANTIKKEPKKKVIVENQSLKIDSTSIISIVSDDPAKRT